MIPMYNTETFQDVFTTVNDFVDFYKMNGIPMTIKEDSASTLYYLLYARYGNNPIANYDLVQFKYKLASVIFQYGPTWEKNLDIQNALRGLNEEELLRGTKQIANHSYNPDSAPSTNAIEELPTINDQNTVNTRRGKLEAYSMLMDLLKTDVTEVFLTKFKHCFKQFVYPENVVLYESED